MMAKTISESNSRLGAVALSRRRSDFAWHFCLLILLRLGLQSGRACSFLRAPGFLLKAFRRFLFAFTRLETPYLRILMRSLEKVAGVG